jgi:competence protein ComFC
LPTPPSISINHATKGYIAVTSINPVRISGKWHDGYALDEHTVRSTFIGYDEVGHALFATQRSPIGELLYRLKYRDDRAALRPLVETIATFVWDEWQIAPQWIIPVPPTRERRFQPVLALANQIGHDLNIPVWERAITKVRRTAELKNVYTYTERVKLLRGAYKMAKGSVRGDTILLFDDLYRSGATLNVLTDLLYDVGHAATVYALTVTKTRSHT